MGFTFKLIEELESMLVDSCHKYVCQQSWKPSWSKLKIDIFKLWKEDEQYVMSWKCINVSTRQGKRIFQMNDFSC